MLLAETIGLWYVYCKMVIPEERFNVALIVFHISILTAFLSISLIFHFRHRKTWKLCNYLDGFYSVCCYSCMDAWLNEEYEGEIGTDN